MKEKLVELLRHCVTQNITLDPDAWDAVIAVDYGKMADSLMESGVTIQKWISVKDRLPEENERVLACYINPLRKDRPPRMMVGEGTSTQIVKGKVYLWCGGWRSITHWMPLPSPPEGE